MCTQVSIATTAVETKEEQAEEEVQDAHEAEVGRRGRGGPPQVRSVVDAIHHIMSKRDTILIKSWFQFQLEEMIQCNQSLPSTLSQEREGDRGGHGGGHPGLQ